MPKQGKLNMQGLLDLLRDHDIYPNRSHDETDFPNIGRIREDETTYTPVVARETGLPPVDETGIQLDDPRLGELLEDIDRILGGRETVAETDASPGEYSPEPHCAWYSPIHYYGHNWGIYIREQCMISCARRIATFVDPQSQEIRAMTRAVLLIRLVRAAFYVFFLHEQFHHKVESLAFRCLVTTGRDRYRPYNSNVYWPGYLTPNCLEESLANADSYIRLSEGRYKKPLGKAIHAAVRKFMKADFRRQAPGYAQAVNYLSTAQFEFGLHKLQSCVLDGSPVPATNPEHWLHARGMIKAMCGIPDEIYLVLPQGAQPIFPRIVF